MIRLYHYFNNFGDDLSPYIISKLSKEKVVYRKPFSFKRSFLDFLRFFKKIFLEASFDKSLLMYSPFHKVIISIGSILEESTSNSVVWGSGLGSRNINIKGGNFLAVRGPLSQQRLAELGFNVPTAIGDPAILLPLIYPSGERSIVKKFKIGIIPHKTDFHEVNEKAKNLNRSEILILNLGDVNLENAIDDIISCQYVLSSSLHGLIVAHSYNIPAVRFRKGVLFGDGSKFLDYFLSVGISDYDPIDFQDIDFSEIENIISAVNKFDAFSLPKNDLRELQKSLLNAAPFYVHESFKKLIN
ncbi:hypothetical protein FHS59_003590 [Algoriphagus iocasae]|uniref:Polysaccharide pyruvyl transferase domain-containing protein n=1 Tax=Algoriphagus iocasae TaxID=1836499 RepID=A0A841MQY9_9BACT|nr:polysaccharide pyruvyl transferase family protein [Algoriphagus iocasae]MBB6327947.1 hypothetical protein [Algoriphagus iocasae]